MGNDVGEVTSAGAICGQCQDDIQEILDELNKQYFGIVNYLSITFLAGSFKKSSYA